jgi:L-malate glycosyltransferase
MIAISEAVKIWLVQRYGLAPEKIQVVYYGIEPERWRSPAQDLRSRWGLDEQLLVGTIGRLIPVKGHDVLIRAMSSVVRQLPGRRCSSRGTTHGVMDGF